MKIKKIIAGVMAAALTVSTMAVNAFAADNLISADVKVNDWGVGVPVEASKFADIAEGDVITVEYTINNEQDYHLVRLTDGAWSNMDCTTKAAANQDDPDFKNQNDGYAVVSVDGSVSYTVSKTDVILIKASGVVVNGFDITVKSVTVGSAAPAATAPEATEPEKDPAETDNSPANDDKNIPITGIEGVAVVAGLAAVAVLGVVIAKKRK